MNVDLKGYRLAFKMGKKYFVGKFEGSKIKKGKNFKQLGLIPKFNKYVTLRNFLRIHKIKKVDPKKVMEDLGVSTLYILDMSEAVSAAKLRVEAKTVELPSISDDLTPKKWEKEFFKVKNYLCIECIHKCKQSARVTIVFCPKYRRK